MSGAMGMVQGIMQSRQAKKQADRARRQMKKERQKLREYENIYKNLDTSNPYLNMEKILWELEKFLIYLVMNFSVIQFTQKVIKMD